MNFKAQNSQLIELIVGANIVSANAQIFFQNQPQLQSISGDRKIYIKGIELFSSEMLSVSPLTSGNAVATPAQIINGTMSINVFGTLSFNYIPLVSLVRIWSAAGTTPHQWDLFQFKGLYQVDWTKTYVTLGNAPAGTPYSYLFNVFYDYDAPDDI